MTDIKAQIKHYSTQAVELSKQAQKVTKQDFVRGKALMKRAIASKSKLSEFDSTISKKS